MSKVAAVFPQAAIADLMTAHVELEVLLELADLRILEGSGADDVYQAPGGQGRAVQYGLQPPACPHILAGEGLLPGCLLPY